MFFIENLLKISDLWTRNYLAKLLLRVLGEYFKGIIHSHTRDFAIFVTLSRDRLAITFYHDLLKLRWVSQLSEMLKTRKIQFYFVQSKIAIRNIFIRGVVIMSSYNADLKLKQIFQNGETNDSDFMADFLQQSRFFRENKTV